MIQDENVANGFDETPPDLHVERGMACVDCHTRDEMHGDGRIYADRFFESEIECQSCHGTPVALSTMTTRRGNPVSGLFQKLGWNVLPAIEIDR